MNASGTRREAPRHEAMVRLLPAYELGALSDGERRAFEGHVLECDTCFEELERGAAVIAELQASAPRFRDILTERPAASVLRSPQVGHAKALFGSWFRPRITVPALVAAVVIALFLVRIPGPDVRELATFPREEVSSIAVRGGGSEDATGELLEIGAGYFDLGRYEEAERHFEAALDRDPELAEAAYFLGLSRVLRGEIDGALSPLARAAGMAAPNRAKYSWVLANAYLRAGQVAEARDVLKALSSSDEEYAERARDLLERLPD